MNENRIYKANSDSKFEFEGFSQNICEVNEVYKDFDSDSSILNLVNTESFDKTSEKAHFPYNSMVEFPDLQEQKSRTNIQSETIDPQLIELFLSQIPHVILVDKPSIQYQILDANYPSLMNSFKQCFVSPVVNMLVVICNVDKQVLFYQGYFSGPSKIADEMINFNGKYWRSLVSNQDGNAWDNHCLSVTEKFKSVDEARPELEVGPIIRCRLRASKSHQLSQQPDYFFVQPCSYLFQLPKMNHTNQGSNLDNAYMMSFINIIRECEPEFFLKGSATVALQNSLSSINNSHGDRQNAISDKLLTKPFTNNGKLSNNTSSTMFMNLTRVSVPTTYPLVNEQHYSRLRSQGQPHDHSITSIDNQYMSRVVSSTPIDQQQLYYQTHYQMPPSTSALQYILENRGSPFTMANHRPVYNTTNQMLPHSGQSYQSLCRSNVPCYVSADQYQPSNDSRQHLQSISANGILLSTEPFYRNGPQGNGIDSRQVTQPMITRVRSLSSALSNQHNQQQQHTDNYFFNASSSQQFPPHVPLSYQGHLSSSIYSPYYSFENNSNNISAQSYQMNHVYNTASIKKEPDNFTSAKSHLETSQTKDKYDSSRYNDNNLTNDSISFDIVEEILEAEEAKMCNGHQRNVDNSNLSFDVGDFGLLDSEKRPHVTFNKDIQSDNGKIGNCKQDEEFSNYSDYLLNLKSETLEKFTNAQRMFIKNLVEQHKKGKLTKSQMLLQINDFIAQIFGKNNHYRHVIEFWKTQHHNIDSTLPSLNCSHVIQSPEEGPGISPSEQAAQSTTDMDGRQLSRHSSTMYNNDHNILLAGQLNRSSAKMTDQSIYSISSTTSTCVLETLLNEHDQPDYTDKGHVHSSSVKVPRSKTFKQQLSLDQLIMDDGYPMVAIDRDEKVNRNPCDKMVRQLSANKRSLSTSVSGNMGVLESLLNQRNPSTCILRQQSTESILKHSKPSRKSLLDSFQDDMTSKVEGNEKENGSKINSLLIVNRLKPTVINGEQCASQRKRQRTVSNFNIHRCENDFTTKESPVKRTSNELDVFEFECSDRIVNGAECPSYPPASTLLSNVPRNRKRCYSKDMNLESDDSSDRESMVDDKIINLTSLSNHRRVDDIANHCSNGNIDFDDIKIENFDVDHMIDLSESMAVNDRTGVWSTQSSIVTCDIDMAPIHSREVHSMMNVSKWEQMLPSSEPSHSRMSDKSSVSLPVTQSAMSLNSESLDNERERLLKQQQKQKVCLGGKYVSLGAPDQDAVNYPLSMESLSQQMKEVVPNVMVEPPMNHSQSGTSRRGSKGQVLTITSPSDTCSITMSVSGRQSLSDTQVDNGKQSPRVNHQQVKEGLRQLVSNRSSQYGSKTCSNNRYAGSTTDFDSLSSDANIIRSSSLNMSMIHYHSDPHTTTNTHIVQSTVPYQSLTDNNSSGGTNILEDSLVNDVFELEELVKSNTSKFDSENTIYRNSPHHHICPSVQSTMNKYDPSHMTLIPDPSRHQHHHQKHPHHHHLPPYYHHHHHQEAVSLPTNHITKDNQQNVTPSTGLLETLLSR